MLEFVATLLFFAAQTSSPVVTAEVAAEQAGKPPPKDWLPLYRGLGRYRRAWLRDDAIAGVTLAAYAIPVSMAYAALAGLPPHCGIYCYLTGGLAYALLGTCARLAVGPTSALSMLVGATIGPWVGGDPARAWAVASLTALLVTALATIAWAAKLNGVVNFISDTILTGFKAGAAVSIATTQLPKLFGVPGGGDHFFERVAVLFAQLPQTNFAVLGVGLATVALLVAGDRYFPGRPIALVAVAAATMATALCGLQRFGVATVGEIPAGLPNLELPALSFRDVDGLLPLAAACFLLSFVESISAARSLAAKHAEQVRSRQEMLALAAANFAAALGQGFPVAGGLSQSAVNDKAGARSPVSLIFASTAIGLCLIFLTGLLKYLPDVVLAGIVLVAVGGLIDMAALRRLLRLSRSEFLIAGVALAGVLMFGILKGVLIAVIASIVMVLTGAASPHVAVLGRIPGTNRFTDAQRHPDNQLILGLLLIRIESSLLYFNVEHVVGQILARVEQAADLREVVCDLSNTPQIDVAGCDALESLRRELAARRIVLRIVEAHASLRELLRAAGLEEQVGYLGRRASLVQAVEDFERRADAAPAAAAERI